MSGLLDLAEIKTIVGHIQPDADVWLAIWLVKRFHPGAKEAELVFVRSGTILPESENDPAVIHVDTGLGPYDHHGKNLGRTCSAALVAAALGRADDQGLTPFIEMVTMADNAEPLPATSVFFLLKGCPDLCRAKDNAVDWRQVEAKVFEIFDIIYGQETKRVEFRAALNREIGWKRLPNGLKLAILFRVPRFKEAAFEAGADVVVWTQPLSMGYYVGVQSHGVNLGPMAAKLREAEFRRRGIKVFIGELYYSGQAGPMDNWFLHDSNNLVLCGSRTHPLAPEARTILTEAEIEKIVCQVLTARSPSRN